MSDLAVVSNSNMAIMPVVNVQMALERYQAMKEFIAGVLRKDVDYGTIPGTSKDTLYKPGAEKLTFFFGLRPQFQDVQTVEDWTGKDHNGEPFFYYRVSCSLYRNNELIASADGSCNSWEKKYRHRWVSDVEIPAHLDKTKLRTRGGRISEFSFAVDKAETAGKYGKPAEYWKRFSDAINNGTATPTKRKTKDGKELESWEIDDTLYCVPNDDIAEQVNTILKMAAKRAFIAAVLIGANASEWFTQDIEDFTDAEYQPINQAQPTATTPITVKVSTPAPVAESNHAPKSAAPKPESTSGMTYETAIAVKDSEGVAYGDIETEVHQHKLMTITASLKKAGITDAEREDKEYKKAAIITILNYRMSHK